MGQSQPSYSAPDQCCQQNEPIVIRTLFQKFENIRMVPIHVFQSICEQAGDDVSDDLFNEKNCSIYERELPHEIFVHILGYLSLKEIIKVGRISKNFQFYWIQKKSLWEGMLNKDDEEMAPYMYFRPVIGSSVLLSLIYYHRYFIPLIRESIKRTTNKATVNIKAILLGPEKSGKSGVLNRIFYGKDFEPIYSPTVGVEFGVQSYEIMNELCTKLQCWDCPGQTIFAFNLRAYTRGAQIVVFCFSLNEEKSFETMKQRVEFYRKENFSNSNWNENLTEANSTLLIFGMKRDLERKVSKSQIAEYISELSQVGDDGILFKNLRIQYFELSNLIDSVDVLEFPFLYATVIEEEYLLEKIVPIIPVHVPHQKE